MKSQSYVLGALAALSAAVPSSSNADAATPPVDVAAVSTVENGPAISENARNQIFEKAGVRVAQTRSFVQAGDPWVQWSARIKAKTSSIQPNLNMAVKDVFLRHQQG